MLGHHVGVTQTTTKHAGVVDRGSSRQGEGGVGSCRGSQGEMGSSKTNLHASMIIDRLAPRRKIPSGSEFIEEIGLRGAQRGESLRVFDLGVGRVGQCARRVLRLFRIGHHRQFTQRTLSHSCSHRCHTRTEQSEIWEAGKRKIHRRPGQTRLHGVVGGNKHIGEGEIQ